jgi:hypothetical protein
MGRMRVVRLVLPILVFALVSCSGSTPSPLPPTASAATSTALSVVAPATPTELGQAATELGPTATDAPATASPAPSATAEATHTGPTATAGPTASATPDPALAVIYAYLAARAAADVPAVTDLACAAFDSQAVTEAISFRSMNAKLNDDLECALSGVDGAYTLVSCTGTMTTTYGPDSRDWDLSNSIYRAALEDGAWTMCGYN